MAMASIFSSLSRAPSLLLFRSKAVVQCRSQPIRSSDTTQFESKSRYSSVWLDEVCAPKRRGILLQIFLSAVSFPVLASDSLADMDVQESFRTYEDETNKFRISVPQDLNGLPEQVPDWSVGAGDTKSFKSVTAFYPEEAADSSSVTVVITSVGPDFTSLKSFGSVDAFAESLVNGLDRSWTSPPGLAANLVDCKAANGLYYIEYTLQNPGENRRHLFTALGMASNGWYNRLYTVTGQFVEDVSDKFRPDVEKSVSSFRLT